MKKNIDKIINEISIKKQELKKEYEKLLISLKEKYGFKIIGKKIIWNKDKKKELEKQKQPILSSINYREILSIPFIYSMIIPAIIIDIFLFIYQQTAVRLYKIPLVKRSDYIIFDRKNLAYLNFIQKINCMYCSYFNGVMQYAVEVAGRTEKYWCPIKHIKKKAGEHEWEKYFAEYGDAKGFKKTFCSIEEFKKIKN